MPTFFNKNFLLVHAKRMSRWTKKKKNRIFFCFFEKYDNVLPLGYRFPNKQQEEKEKKIEKNNILVASTFTCFQFFFYKKLTTKSNKLFYSKLSTINNLYKVHLLFNWMDEYFENWLVKVYITFSFDFIGFYCYARHFLWIFVNNGKYVF